ncbi:hypothetical protein Tco_0803959 [Tanacetum coccineum]|uniref:Uncharacterized protein n=1 Tax=Tanacetum coccineum TaxID=301880 RepID=A0ABQ5A5T8_9ASTR
MPRLPLEVCSPLCGAPKDRSYDIIATKQSEKYKCRNIFPTSSNIAIHASFGSNDEEVVPKEDDVSLVDGVYNGAFGGDGEEDVVIGEGMVVASSLLEMLTKSCLGGMMVSLIFLEGLEEEA